MHWEAFFLNPAVVWVLIPVSAILIGGISGIYSQYCKHVERISMIENGIHPDSDEDAAPAATNPGQFH